MNTAPNKLLILLVAALICFSGIVTATPGFIEGTIIFNETFDGSTWNVTGTFTGDSAFYPTQNDNATLHKGDSATWNFQEVWINDVFPAVGGTQVAWQFVKTGSGGEAIFMCMIDLSQHTIGDSQIASMDYCYYDATSGKIYEEGTDKASSVWGHITGDNYWLKMNISSDGSVDYWYKTDTATSFTLVWDSTQKINTTFSMVWDVASSTGHTYKIDEVYIWNDSIVSVGAEIDIFVLNPDYDKISFLNLTESQPFFIGANYTQSGSVLEGGNCSFTSLNISAHFVESSIHNFSLNNTQDQLSLTFNETTDNAILDRGELSVCRIKGNSALSVYVNGNLHRTTDQSIIPLCSNGVHFITNTSTNYTDQNFINLTLKCDSCSAGVKELKVLSIDNERMHLERDYSTHTEPLIFNSTLDYYIYPTNLYHYVRAGVGIGNISVTCNDTTTEKVFNLIDKPLNVSIISINEVSYVDGLNVESSALTTILIEISDDEVVFLDFNVTYLNGSLIKQSSQEFITLTAAQLNIDGFYNISINAIDDEGNTTSKTGFFEINDTTVPVITFVFPLIDNSSTITMMNNHSINISFSDINLYAYNFTLIYPNKSIERNMTEVGITGEIINIFFNKEWITDGSYVINLEVADNHHLSGTQLVKDWSVVETTDSLKYNDCITITGENALSTKSEKYDYFYDFEFTWDDKSIGAKHIIVNSCSPLDYIEDSRYKAHFVNYEKRIWIDFEGVNEKPIVTYMGNNSYELTYYSLPNAAKFNSIGGLNIVSESVSFQVLEEIYVDPYVELGNNTPESFSRRIDVNTTPGILMLFLYLAICTTLTGIGVVFGSGEIVAFSGIVWLIFGFIIAMNTSVVFGFVLAIFGVLLLIIGGMSLSQ